jgi:hypothetical protein
MDTTTCVGVACVVATVYILASLRIFLAPKLHEEPVLVPPEQYADCGFGSLSSTASPASCYLDLMKRVVLNIVYHETSLPLFFYDHNRKPQLAKAFDLKRRCKGEDMPGNAFSMIGLERLDNVQQCIETVLKDKVPGDLLEAGACKGGACIFMRAVLKAHGCAEKKVVVCDTFVPTKPMLPGVGGKVSWFLALPLFCLAELLIRIPIRPWQTWVYAQMLKGNESFPSMDKDADGEGKRGGGEDEVDLAMFVVSNMASFRRSMLDTSLEAVKSNFARMGLLDSQVVFLEGFFSDTIPGQKAYEKLSLLRVDGDTYESTRDTMNLMYPAVAQGGFVIIDDYNAFEGCAQAVDEYRKAHQINTPMLKIDNLGVYWRVGQP